MATNEYPRLCGGTFFTLLLQARQQRSKAREHIKGERDGLADTDMLIGLLKIINPDYIEPTAPAMGSFKTSTSNFKSCKISKGTYLPLNDTAAFDNRIKIRYEIPLRLMCAFVETFIDIGTSTEKDVWLARAILELIDTDQSILDTQGFYINENGAQTTKDALRNVTSICLPPFLLGIWHFVLMSRDDNTVGKATYDNWCPSNNHSIREYTGNMGNGIIRALTVTTVHIDEPVKNDVYIAKPACDSYSEYEEPYIEDHASESYTSATAPAINAPAVFFNSGANCIQISNSGTLNIDRGRDKNEQ